jgi:hypothetical protein
MNAAPWDVPDGPVDQAPTGYAATSECEEILRHALTTAGVELGSHDERIVQWMANWDWPTVATVTSWITRAAQTTQDRSVTDRTCGCPGEYHLSDCPGRQQPSPDPGDLADAFYAHDEDNQCEGHESLNGAHMGEAVYCDGTCQR